MPDLSREQIEEQLLAALRSARLHYEWQEFSPDEYVRALKTFTEFILDGILPDDLKPKPKPVRCEKAGRRVRKKTA